jgi:branched-chain amino acid transport system ATP-binding protein
VLQRRDSFLLRLEGVTKRFGGVVAVDQVSLGVEEGCVTALIGPNGAGKTTVFNLINGIERVTSGSIWFNGEKITGQDPKDIVRRGLARTFQSIRLFRTLSVREHIRVAQKYRVPLWRRLLPLATGEAELEGEADAILDFLDLVHVQHRRASTLPYGIQRRVELARALALRPKLLLLDEPVAGMNVSESAELRRSILHMRDRGLTIFLIEHDMGFVMSIADYIFVLDHGVVIAEGRPHEIQRDRRVLEAYLGEELLA